MRKQRGLYILGWLVAVGLFSGCQTVQFYAQAIGGQLEIMQKQKPIHKIMAASGTSLELKRQLVTVLALREFAETNLHLPTGGHYVRYADLRRPCVVWVVQATPEFSLKPKSWWYPLVGQAKYRGYFAEENAQAYAEKLRRQGDDVYVEGVEAYSTLGWFKDPLLNTFIYRAEASLAEIIFHELAHQRVFASGDTDFNEALATVVGEEGTRCWLASVGNTDAIEKYQVRLGRQHDFVTLVQQTRAKLQAVYENTRGEAAQKREQKGNVLREMREEYAQLKARWGGYSGYDSWFQSPLNNAQLNTVAAYYDLVPAFSALRQSVGGDWEKFYQETERLARLPKSERWRQLGRR